MLAMGAFPNRFRTIRLATVVVVSKALRLVGHPAPDGDYYSWKSVLRRIRLVTGWSLIILAVLAVLNVFALEKGSDAWWSLAGLLVFGVPGYFLVFRFGSTRKHQPEDNAQSE